ncbi:MAG: hypothetical protein IMF12_09360 [Proteobacteria bacterium]|nr:hypothetical protein [Pseudomonadota bacterium]
MEALNIYHSIFIAIFVGTTILTFGSVLNIGIFSKIDDKYTKTLFVSLLVAIAGAVFIFLATMPDIMNNLYVLYHLVFISIFLATAVVALGAMLKVGIFAKVDNKYTNLLAGALLVELVGAVVQSYMTLPAISYNQAEEWGFELQYVNYLDDWKKTLDSVIDRQCVDEYVTTRQLAMEEADKCFNNMAVGNYIAQADAVGGTGRGLMFLSYNDKNLRFNGIMSYKFPKDVVESAFSMSGKKHNSKERTLLFSQKKRLYCSPQYGSSGLNNCKERNGYEFEITFYKEKMDFIGVLRHPKLKLNGENIIIANAILYPR